MAKLSAICFLLLVLIVFTGDELLVPVAEAKDCNKVWNCKGDKRCWDDCKNRYNGKGLCDLYTAPGVPKQCFCAYKC
ncbi:putative defensin-like protein 184 isoform X2 [Pistacia vera]|uniref:putative defensin-like protein 184 isoform X2 n=1 Tax=Pistacia vera TaxID=55513 RepID=UPI00126343B4|nr:putative defensin-like protein 184 isoform X2 [Pistacia vera]